VVQAKHILERPAQFQWDSDSNPCQSSNCRCTSEAMIAGFYGDIHISPESMRHAMGYSSCGGTTAPAGVTGLRKFGVAASWGRLTSYEVINKLNLGIPVDIAVLYGRIPRNSSYIQDMHFTGLHSVVACKRALVGTKYGLWIRDPDRWGTGKVERVFWPDSVWIPAFAGANYVATWPNKPKITTPSPIVLPYGSYLHTRKYVVTASDGLNQRNIPNATSIVEALRPVGYTLTSALKTDKGGSYTGPAGIKSTSWVATRTNDGKYHWFAAAFLKAV
jgi:hypothetical protein